MYLVAHYAFAAAFARADVSTLAPFEYTALVWATIIGYVIHRESLRHRAKKTAEG